MLTEQGNKVIKKVPEKFSENYSRLREQGLQYIQQYSGKLWTDYNVHDPGITMLELLCYAITDLAYRTSFDVADILTPPNGKGPDETAFYTARKILTTHPITTHDYRKLLLDRIPGLRNVWLEMRNDTAYTPTLFFDQKKKLITLTSPAHSQWEKLKLRGLYKVKIEVEEFETILGQHPHNLRTLAKYRDLNSPYSGELAVKEEYTSCIVNHVRKTLWDSRNLCEDFVEIELAQPEYVAVCADFELHPSANADQVYLKIMSLVQAYINPNLQFYSIAELLKKGKTIEDIFSCSAAVRGFIDDDELRNHGHKEELHVSDIINLLMDIPGVVQIKKIHLTSYRKNEDNTYTKLQNAQPYCLKLQDSANAVFRFVLDAGEQQPQLIFNHINFSKGPIYFTAKRLPEYADLQFLNFPDMPENFENDLKFPKGNNRELDFYFSVQNEFPLAYYLGRDGIPSSADTLRKAQRLQQKAYLLFFDQVLANYLAQLNHLRRIYNWNEPANLSTLHALPLEEKHVNDLRLILASNQKEDADDVEFFSTTYAEYNDILESPAQRKSRRNRLLDHLLARFNEVFADYSVFKFSQAEGEVSYEMPSTTETINDKIQLLKVYPIISGKRSHAFNYTKAYWGTNISGLQLRLLKMLGLNGSSNKQLVKAINNPKYLTLLQQMQDGQPPEPANQLLVDDNRFSDFDSNFGLHVLEHILLRPLQNSTGLGLSQLLPLCGDGSNTKDAMCLHPDVYSMHLTIVLPGWLAVAAHADFRKYTEELIRTEVPAHLLVKICWIDPALMFLFEKTTEAFFKQMAQLSKPGIKLTKPMVLAYHQSLNELYQMMGLLKNMYLPAALDECEAMDYNVDTQEMKVPVILNHSALGMDEERGWFIFQQNQERKIKVDIKTPSKAKEKKHAAPVKKRKPK